MRLIRAIQAFAETLPAAFAVWRGMAALQHVEIEFVSGDRRMGTLNISIDPAVVSPSDPFVQFLADTDYGIDWTAEVAGPSDEVLMALAVEYARRGLPFADPEQPMDERIAAAVYMLEDSLGIRLPGNIVSDAMEAAA